MNLKIILLSTLLVSINFAFSQNISVKSFKKLENDIEARINPVQFDGDDCALLKIGTSVQNLKFEGGTLSIAKKVQKTGEVWVYVPYGARFLTIKHQQLGILRNYEYPTGKLQKATTYEMVLITAKLTTTINQNIPKPTDLELIKNWKATALKYLKLNQIDKAYEFYNKAALKKDAEAQMMLGGMYEKGSGVSQSYEKAVFWYSKSAEQNNEIAQRNLALLYFTGKGVSKDKLIAEQLLVKSAKRGNKDTQYYLASLYSLPQKGLYYDLNKAIKWYQLAIKQGHLKAQEDLGALYFEEKNYKEAAKWYLLAANNGIATSQFVLGYMYRNGLGVKKSRKKAKNMWRKACAQGHKTSCNEIKKMNAFGNALLKTVGESLDKAIKKQ